MQPRKWVYHPERANRRHEVPDSFFLLLFFPATSWSRLRRAAAQASAPSNEKDRIQATTKSLGIDLKSHDIPRVLPAVTKHQP